MPSWIESSVSDQSACVDDAVLFAAMAEIVTRPAKAEVVVIAEGDARVVTVVVTRNEAALWTKEFRTVASACPTMPDAIAASVAAALRRLDGEGAPGERELVSESQLTLSATVGLPFDVATDPWQPRFGAGARTRLDPGWVGLVLVGARAEFGLPFAVGPGEAQVSEVCLAAGLSLDAGRGWTVLGGLDGGLALTHALCDEVVYPDQHADFSWKRVTDGADDWCFATTPTPEGTNDDAPCMCGDTGASEWC